MLEKIKLTTEDERSFGFAPYTITHLATAEMYEIDITFQQTTPIQSCFNTVVNFLCAGGIRVTKKNFIATPTLQDEIDTRWMCVLKKLLHDIWCYGFCIIDMNEDGDPYVVDPTTVRIVYIEGPRGFKRIRIEDDKHKALDGKNEAMSSPMFYCENSNNFTGGSIVSKINSLRRMESFESLMLACTANAEVRRSIPPLMMEHVNVPSENKNLLRDYSQIGDSSDLLRANTDRMSYDDLEQSLENERRTEQLGDGSSTGMSSRDPINGIVRYPTDRQAMTYVNTRITVDRGKKLVTNQQPTAPSNLADIMMLVEADCCCVLGVPKALMGSSRTSLATQSNVMEIFNITVSAIKKMMSLIFREAMTTVFGKANAEHAISKNIDKKRTLDENKEDNQIQISFPSCLSDEVILFLQESGSMKWDTLNAYKSARYGIPIADLAPKQLEIATGKPLGQIVEAERKMQEDEMKMKEQTMKDKAKEASKPSPGASGASGASQGKQNVTLKINLDKSSKPSPAKKKKVA